jgi:hypothetical protein
VNFEDEAYVRVYKRKTITYKRLGWEGRTVLWHLMLEADRAGIIELGEGDTVEAVATLCDLPEEVVSVGIARLTSQGVTERHGTSLLVTRFIEAQEATRSDKARAKDYRERRRAQLVTPRDEASQGVTVASRVVTDRHSEQSSTEQSSTEEQPSVVASGKPPRKPKPVRWRKVPESWQPNEGHQKLAADHGVNLAAELPKFRDHEFAQPKSDADACFRTWLRTAAEIGLRRPAPGFVQHQAQTVEAARRPELQLFRPKPVSNPVSADEFARFAGKRP